MTDNVNSLDFHLEGRSVEMRLRALRRRFRTAPRGARDPFTALELAFVGLAVFLAVFSLGLFGLS